MLKYPFIATLKSDGPQLKELNRAKSAFLKDGFSDVKISSTGFYDLEGTVSGRSEIEILKRVQRFSEQHQSTVLDVQIVYKGIRLSPIIFPIRA